MAEYIKVPAGVYDMVTRCMEQEFPDHVAIRYVAEDGKTVVDYTTEALERHGLQRDGALLRAAGVTVYPAAYFCPMDYDTGALHITDETRSIHHYCASWHNAAQQYALELKRKMVRFLPRKPAAVLATAVAKTKFEGFGACVRWVFKRR